MERDPNVDSGSEAPRLDMGVVREVANHMSERREAERRKIYSRVEMIDISSSVTLEAEVQVAGYNPKTGQQVGKSQILLFTNSGDLAVINMANLIGAQ